MTNARAVSTLLTVVLAACQGDPEEGAPMESTGSTSTSGGATPVSGSSVSASGATQPSSSATSPTSSTSSSTPDTSSTAVDPTGSGESGETTGPSSGLPFVEDFEGRDASPWPDPFSIAGNNVVAAELDGGRGRLQGLQLAVARVVTSDIAELDTDVQVTVTFGNATRQGFGFYVRQNGGAVTQTDPPGQGYAVFLEGDGDPQIGIWHELDGNESPIQVSSLAAPLQSDTPYRVRFTCVQAGDVTELRAKYWIASEPEPDAWDIELTDDAAPLQNTAGGFAVDVFNYEGMPSLYVDDLEVVAP